MKLPRWLRRRPRVVVHFHVARPVDEAALAAAIRRRLQRDYSRTR